MRPAATAVIINNPPQIKMRNVTDIVLSFPLLPEVEAGDNGHSQQTNPTNNNQKLCQAQTTHRHASRSFR